MAVRNLQFRHDRSPENNDIYKVVRVPEGPKSQGSHPGYRVYFVQPDAAVVILLSGGDKDSQQADIVKAKEIAKQLEV
jgi:putative component of toxin-antitoxin plasmid stabilization module